MDRLSGGGTLRAGEELTSPNGRYAFRMQHDGDCVLFRESRPIWATDTSHDDAEHLEMRADGDLVVVAENTSNVWSSHTSGSAGASLVLQDDGNLVVYSPDHRARWATNTTNVTTANRRVYTVAHGDSLWRIAEKIYGDGPEYMKIATANNIPDPDHIHAGQCLIIPE